MKKRDNQSENIKQYSHKQIQGMKDRTDYERLDKMTDNDIDYSDIPELKASVWAKAEIKTPINKKAISLRVDHDMLAWYKQQSDHYQRLMNKVLRQYMNMH